MFGAISIFGLNRNHAATNEITGPKNAHISFHHLHVRRETVSFFDGDSIGFMVLSLDCVL